MNIFLFFLISLVLMITIIFFNEMFNLGITNNDLNIFLSPFIMLIYFWIASPNLRKHLNAHFIRVKAFDRVVLLPVLLAILVLFFVYFYFYFPALIDKGPLSIGSSQYQEHHELTTAGEILLLGIMAPFNEEFLFRFLFIFYLPYLILNTLLKKPIVAKKDPTNKKFTPFVLIQKVANEIYCRVFVMKDRRLIGVWAILVSFFFALVHGPDIYSFPIYFVPGMLFSFVYLKYGFLASWICHGTTNALSGMINSIFISFING